MAFCSRVAVIWETYLIRWLVRIHEKSQLFLFVVRWEIFSSSVVRLSSGFFCSLTATSHTKWAELSNTCNPLGMHKLISIFFYFKAKLLLRNESYNDRPSTHLRSTILIKTSATTANFFRESILVFVFNFISSSFEPIYVAPANQITWPRLWEINNI